MPVKTTQKEVVDAAKEIVKKKQVRPRKSEQMKVHTEPGDNAKYINHTLTFLRWQKPDITNPEAVKQRVIDYFKACEEHDMKPSVESLGLAFGGNRKTVWKWANGIECNYVPEESRNVIRAAYDAINSMMADYMQNGKINPVSGIFLMKNNMGYSDQTEIVVTPNNPLGAEASAEEVQKRITEGVVVEIEE